MQFLIGILVGMVIGEVGLIKFAILIQNLVHSISSMIGG